MTRLLPVLRYPGAKWGIAPWIISHFPAHEAYVEPFFGSGAVLMRKIPSRSELANDIDGSVVAFFRVLRDRPQELAAALALTPYARQELAACRRAPDELDDVEKARRLAVSCWQTRGGAQSRRQPGWRFDMYGAANKSLAGTWATLPARVLAVATRFASVAIECRPALEVIDILGKSRDGGRNTLIYADPPYLLGSIDQRLYRHGMKTEAEHAELLDALDRYRGPVLLSSYPSPLYAERLAQWSSVSRRTRNQANDARTEVLWMNPVAANGQIAMPFGSNDALVSA